MFSTVRAFAIAGAFAFASLLPATHASAEIRDPLPRFEDRVCPGVMGLDRDTAELLVGRIRSNAKELGLVEADAASCEPNIVVAFVTDGQAYLRRLEDRRGHLFVEMTPKARKELLDKEGPARAFLTTETRTRDGIRVNQRTNLVDLPQMRLHQAHSKIFTAARKDITSALVLFDVRAIDGLSVAQLADYATMLAFLHQPPEPEQASILHLFDASAERPAGLTSYDRAYLKGMYEGLPNLPSDVRMAEVEQRVEREAR